MEGDGALQNWLWQTGKDIGRAVGPHLKKAAKEKALAYAQEHLGSGLADELGSAAKSVGSAALGSIRDGYVDPPTPLPRSGHGRRRAADHSVDHSACFCWLFRLKRLSSLLSFV